ncbi:hypothetical protein C2E23DRAFT_726294 [Lenzites betulinus]|nr:hypothetical protein C2E23DRAFT_726294 [Lenzites betulinus]
MRGNDFPEDLLLIVISHLGRSDLNALLRSCKRFYGILVPRIYRTLRLDISPEIPRTLLHPHNAIEILNCLMGSLRHASSEGDTSRFLPQFIHSLTYVSYDPRYDMRALPMLSTILQFTAHLRYLHLDVLESSVPLVLEALRRRGILRNPPASMLEAIRLPAQTSLTLPRLETMRSTKAAVVAAVLERHPLKTIVIDHAFPMVELPQLLPHTPSSATNSLTRLSLSFYSHQTEVAPIVKAIGATFPSLIHVALHSPARTCIPLLEAFIAILTSEYSLLTCLRAMSVNHGGRRRAYTDTLQDMWEAISELGHRRPPLREVIMGRSMVSRIGEEAPWQLIPHIDLSQWAWLLRSSTLFGVRRSLIRTLLHPRSLGRPQLPSSILLSMRSAARVPQLRSSMPTGVFDTTSPFERFLLGAPDDVIDKFFSPWSPDLIIRLRSLNSNVFLGVEAYIARAWDVEKSFDRWFFHVNSFLRTLESCGAIVSGSEAQQHFGRHEYRGSDLDIYVPFHGLLRMGRWLKQEGYLYQASGGKHVFFDAAAIMVASAAGQDFTSHSSSSSKASGTYTTFNFVRPQDDTLKLLRMDGSHVQLIAVRQDPVQFIIEHFHSTGVMNYIAGTFAASLFPRATFVDRQMVVCQDTTRNSLAHEIWKEKYRRRGFTIIEAVDDPPCTLETRQWLRNVGDKATWVLPHARSSMLGLLSESSVDIRGPGFEVLPSYSGVAPSGAALRIGPKFVYR